MACMMSSCKIMVRDSRRHVQALPRLQNHRDVWQMVSDHNFAPTFPNLAGHCAAKILHLTLSDHHASITTAACSLSLWLSALALRQISVQRELICISGQLLGLGVVLWGSFGRKNMRVRPMVFSPALTASTLHHQMLDDFNFQTQTLPQPNSILYPPKDALYLAA